VQSMYVSGSSQLLHPYILGAFESTALDGGRQIGCCGKSGSGHLRLTRGTYTLKADTTYASASILVALRNRGVDHV
jgi:hypothetical protein